MKSAVLFAFVLTCLAGPPSIEPRDDAAKAIWHSEVGNGWLGVAVNGRGVGFVYYLEYGRYALIASPGGTYGIRIDGKWHLIPQPRPIGLQDLRKR